MLEICSGLFVGALQAQMHIEREYHDDHKTDEPAHEDSKAHETMHILTGVVLQQKNCEYKGQNRFYYSQNKFVHFI